MENVRISNITMAHIRNEAILFDMYYAAKQDRPEPLSERTPQFRNFHIANIVCRSAEPGDHHARAARSGPSRR